MPDTTEKLLLQTIHFLSKKFKEKFVLEGGMLLRLLNSPRSTQDIDCFLISSDSKKTLASAIKKMLEQFGLARVTSVEVHSRGIFMRLQGNGPNAEKIRLEISVVGALNLPTEPFATTALAGPHGVGAQIVQTIALAEAFANKIAAAIERDNARDLYDITLFEPLCAFDRDTFEKRLEKISIQRQKPRTLNFKGAADFLKKRVEKLTEEKLQNELYPLLPAVQQRGLLRIIQSALARVIQQLE